MVKNNGYSKNIACLESLWTDDVENRLTLVPILEILNKKNGTRSVSLSCNTADELRFNFDLLRQVKGYGILYLAFHGFRGGIYLPGLEVDLEAIAKLMGRSFRNWIVYFSSCRTMDVERVRILNFISLTGVRVVMGFRNTVTWVDSTALDLIVLDRLQHYKNMGRFWNGFRRTYKGLVSRTGLEMIRK